jgi:uncharacterized membrane protein
MDEANVTERRGWGGRMERRPHIRPPRSRAEIGWIALAVFGWAALLVVTLYWWASLPMTIPTHFGLDGQPDSYGPKETVFFLPGILVILLALFAAFSRYPGSSIIPWSSPQRMPRVSICVGACCWRR